MKKQISERRGFELQYSAISIAIRQRQRRFFQLWHNILVKKSVYRKRDLDPTIRLIFFLGIFGWDHWSHHTTSCQAFPRRHCSQALACADQPSCKDTLRGNCSLFLVNFVIRGVPLESVGGGAPLGSCKINALVRNCSKQDFQNTQFWGQKNAVRGVPVFRLNSRTEIWNWD